MIKSPKKLPPWFIQAGHKLPPRFPLTLYVHGYKKRIGRSVRHVAGKVAPAEAMRLYADKLPRLLAAEQGPALPKRTPFHLLAVQQLVGRYLKVRLADAKRAEGEPGAIRWQTYSCLRRDLIRLADGIGRGRMVAHLEPDDFTTFLTRAEREHSADAVRRIAKATVAMIRYAAAERWTPVPIETGRRFASVASTNPRRRRRDLFSVDEVRVLVAAAKADVEAAQAGRPGVRGGQRPLGPPLQIYAMILLALNGGYGQTDLARLPTAEVDLVRGVIDRPRTKTGVERVVPLWAETRAALAEVIALRPGDALAFRTKQGHPYVRDIPKVEGSVIGAKVNSIDSIQMAFGKLVRRLELQGHGRGFYALRHVHRTIADEAKDVHAAMRIVGHALPGMNDVYVDAIGHDRLRRVTEHVRAKVLGGLCV